jgi:hypothetical protein
MISPELDGPGSALVGPVSLPISSVLDSLGSSALGSALDGFGSAPVDGFGSALNVFRSFPRGHWPRSSALDGCSSSLPGTAKNWFRLCTALDGSGSSALVPLSSGLVGPVGLPLSAVFDGLGGSALGSALNGFGFGFGSALEHVFRSFPRDHLPRTSALDGLGGSTLGSALEGIGSSTIGSALDDSALDSSALSSGTQ